MARKSMSIAQLRRELARREKSLATLVSRRAKVAKQLASLDADIAALGGGRAAGSVAGTRGRRPGPTKGARKGTRTRAKNKMTLPDSLVAAVRKGATVSPAEAGKAVKAKGYTTTSKTFGIQVASALTKDKRFKKVGRGQYQLVGGAPAAAKPRKAAKKGRRRKKTAAKRK
jgi:hypothetical protein